ncbi:hypothetical protein [Terribacillus sp. 7520-G]|uniref:hypothetical protein n=1 Tax=Terribacillus TaxID=459532 RepID=UPI000BA6BBD0|nr:hypothetical protein [Terribacillus sp. 7520-G]PAD38276.1 hypothetical protein CHH53_11930 [Terribacillus sp. 7520-G]
MGGDKQSGSPSEMNSSELPDVAAFQDEFTRDFIQKSEPTKEGYYSFKSGSNSFTMDFPENLVVIRESYNKDENDGSEMIELSLPKSERDKIDAVPVVKLHYYDFMSSEENSKESITARSSGTLEFKSLESVKSDQHIQYAENKDGIYPGLSGLVWNDNNQQIQIFASVVCKEGLSDEECETKAKPIKDSLVEILSSIQFLKEGNE